jgi:hypothetical protein
MADDDLKKIIKDRNPSWTDEDIDLWGESSDFWATENYRNSARWSLRLSNKLFGQHHYPNNRFFIDFFGVFGEVRSFLNSKAQAFKDLGFGESDEDIRKGISKLSNEAMREHLYELLRAWNLIEKLSASISDDELFLIEYLRHRYCHPTLTGYSVQIVGRKGSKQLATMKYERLKSLNKTNVEQLKKDLTGKMLPLSGELRRLSFMLAHLGGGH